MRERRLDFGAIQIKAQAAAKSDKQRAIVFERGEPAVPVPVVSRADLAPTPAAGPLVIEEFDATIVVPAGAAVHRDRIGNVVIDLGAEW